MESCLLQVAADGAGERRTHVPRSDEGGVAPYHLAVVLQHELGLAGLALGDGEGVILRAIGADDELHLDLGAVEAVRLDLVEVATAVIVEAPGAFHHGVAEAEAVGVCGEEGLDVALRVLRVDEALETPEVVWALDLPVLEAQAHGVLVPLVGHCGDEKGAVDDVDFDDRVLDSIAGGEGGDRVALAEQEVLETLLDLAEVVLLLDDLEVGHVVQDHEILLVVLVGGGVVDDDLGALDVGVLHDSISLACLFRDGLVSKIAQVSTLP